MYYIFWSPSLMGNSEQMTTGASRWSSGMVDTHAASTAFGRRVNVVYDQVHGAMITAFVEHRSHFLAVLELC